MNADSNPSDSSSPAGGSAAQSPEPPKGASSDEIERDIERTREELGRTVDALAAKADVKTRVQQRTAEIRRDRPEVLYGGAGGALALVALVVGLVLWRRRR